MVPQGCLRLHFLVLLGYVGRCQEALRLSESPLDVALNSQRHINIFPMDGGELKKNEILQGYVLHTAMLRMLVLPRGHHSGVTNRNGIRGLGVLTEGESSFYPAEAERAPFRAL